MSDRAAGPDYFALLGAPRLPWLDPTILKNQFLEQSTSVHPDRVHGAEPALRREANERYAALNAAWRCLGDAKERLGHLLTLELGARPQEVHEIPPATASLFEEVVRACRSADGFLSRRTTVASPILQARQFAEAAALADLIRGIQQRLQFQQESLEQSLRELNSAWEMAPPPGSSERAARLPLDRIETAWRALSYIKRWGVQLQERWVRLAS